MELEQLSSHTEKSFRPTWIEVDLSAIGHNVDQLRSQIKPDTQLLVPLKANAYGHGAIAVGKYLEEKGVDFFGVASIDEAVTLRQGGIRTPILILNTILEEEVEAVFDHQLTQTVCTEELAIRFNQRASLLGKKIPVHVKVDTGMGRIGIWHEEALELVRFIRGLPYLDVQGLFTHLATADGTGPEATQHQIASFRTLVGRLEKESLLPPLLHVANSAGLLAHAASHFNLVRPGLAVYGISPFTEKNRSSISLHSALSLKSKICFLKKVARGRRISYGGTYTTDKETVIATVPIGYADGYNRLLSNKGKVLVRGRRAPVAGRVCMDQLMIDVGQIPAVGVGDEVVLIGRQGTEEITVNEIAIHCKTIPYEVLCWFSARIPRLYLDDPSHR